VGTATSSDSPSEARKPRTHGRFDSGKSVALAGIIATAVVGVAGAASSWLIARDDRANQRALAHDARVYDRRANAYVDALRLLLTVFDAATDTHHRVPRDVHRSTPQVRRLRAALTAELQDGAQRVRPTLLAFGSNDASVRFAGVVASELKLIGLVNNDIVRRTAPPGAGYGSGTVAEVGERLFAFERAIRLEVG
jgi:hypothetical protein